MESSKGSSKTTEAALFQRSQGTLLSDCALLVSTSAHQSQGRASPRPSNPTALMRGSSNHAHQPAAAGLTISPSQLSRSRTQRAHERLSTSKTELGIFTAGSAFVRASRAFQRRLCMDWQKESPVELVGNPPAAPRPAQTASICFSCSSDGQPTCSSLPYLGLSSIATVASWTRSCHSSCIGAP